MAALNMANIKKTIYYLQRNGLKNTWYAAKERMAQTKELSYVYGAPSRRELEQQREIMNSPAGMAQYAGIDFSIVVPLYRTKPVFLQELVDSIQAQTYPFWELVLADATEDDSVWEVVKTFSGVENLKGDLTKQADESHSDTAKTECGIIRYVHLASNEGISANTNAALPYATKQYIGLLDHDDLLTPDALFEMAEEIKSAKEQGQELALIYSDEDKCNGEGTSYFEPNFKERFNYDLILSNNYICHFMVMKSDFMKKLRFRPEYDGAQDYDLVLRAVAELGIPQNPEKENCIGHVSKVLYHWRCHVGSTAENPRSKEYAYEAGRRALQYHTDACGFKGNVVSLKHMGFYQVQYEEDIFAVREDIGALGGPLFKKGKIVGGRMDSYGNVFYEKLHKRYSGYLHRAVLRQNAEAVDIRNMSVRPQLRELFQKITGVAYQEKPGMGVFDASLLPANTDYRAISLQLCKAIRDQGYRILWSRRENE